MLKLPFHRHLTWLCLEDTPYEEVCRFYDNIQYPKPSREQYDSIMDSRKNLGVTLGMRKRLGFGRYSDDDAKMWDKIGFGEMYLHRMAKFDWSELGKLLNHPLMRIALESVLIAKLEPEEIEQMFPTVFSLPVSKDTIELFKKYFFDTSHMQRQDWQEYLHMIVEDRYAYTRIFAALTKPRDEVLHLVGLPTKVQFGTMLKNIMTTANYRFEYFARQQDPEAQDQARKWAKVLIEAGVKHEKFSASDATDFSKLIQTEFEHIDDPIQTIAPEMLSEIKPQLQLETTKGPEAPLPPDADAATRDNGL